MSDKPYLVYLIRCRNKSYVGMTNDFWRRWRQHNGILKGGARYTTKYRQGDIWEPILIIDNFQTMKEAMQCEWKLKRKKGYLARIIWAHTLLTRHDRWTSKSPLIKDQSLHVYLSPNYQRYFKNYMTRELVYI